MTTVRVPHDERNRLRRIVWATASGTGLAFAAWVSYELTTRILTSAMSSRDDQLLGGMWSVIATVFVCRESYQQSIGAALSRTAATSLSFILCLGYLLLLPFSSSGMALLIGIGVVILILIKRPGEVITTSITTAVVMVVAESAHSMHGVSPILRLFDTLIGISVGTAAVWIGKGLYCLGHFTESTVGAEESQLKITKETMQ
jgi:Fusaric acid resistance protein-like